MIVDHAHPIIRAIRAGAADADAGVVRRAAEDLEVGLAGALTLLDPRDDTIAAGQLSAAMRAIGHARAAVVNIAGGRMTEAMRYLDTAHRDLHRVAIARLGPGQSVVAPCHEPLP